jgi:hypothetical protein
MRQWAALVILLGGVLAAKAQIDDNESETEGDSRRLSTSEWLRHHPWARPPPPPFQLWTGEQLDHFAREAPPSQHRAKPGAVAQVPVTKFAEHNFTGSAVAELVLNTPADRAQELLKEVVEGGLGERLRMLHRFRGVVRPSPPPSPAHPPKPSRPPPPTQTA